MKSKWFGRTRALFPAALLLLSGGAVRAELPPQEVMFGNPERSHPELSPDGTQLAWLARDPVTDVIQAVEFDYSAPRCFFLDPKIKADFETIGREVPGLESPASPRRGGSALRIDPISRDAADRKWIVTGRRSDAPAVYYIFDRDTKAE